MFLFGVRGFAAGFFQGIYVYTPEVKQISVNSVLCHDRNIDKHSQVYPTAVRAFGVSLCTSVSKLGSMIAPYIAQVNL